MENDRFEQDKRNFGCIVSIRESNAKRDEERHRASNLFLFLFLRERSDDSTREIKENEDVCERRKPKN